MFTCFEKNRIMMRNFFWRITSLILFNLFNINLTMPEIKVKKVKARSITLFVRRVIESLTGSREQRKRMRDILASCIPLTPTMDSSYSLIQLFL